MPSGILYLVGTPIGHLGDLSPRAIETLKAVDRIACEDTRHSGQLLARLGIQKPLLSYHHHNRRAAGAFLAEKLASGEAIALVSDAGMPGISDPGEELVRLALQAGAAVVPVPGPTALVTALVASGLASDRFVFEGFLPRSGRERRERLAELAQEARTIVLYEAPHRLVETLADLHGALGDRQASVARELTKLHEEFQRGPLGALRRHFEQTPPRGEIVLVVAGAPAPEGPRPGWEDALAEALGTGMKPSEAAKQIARAYRMPRSEVYQRAISP